MTLTNPQAADHIAAEAGSFEPQRQNNFSVEIAGLSEADRDLIILALETCPLPNESNEEIEIRYQNEVRKVAGQYIVENLTLSVKDFVDKEVRTAIMRWRNLVYNPNTGKIGLASNYKKRARIIMTAPDGSNSRICKCHGCWPQNVVGGNLDMTGSDKVLIEVTITVDKAKWELANLTY
jgi:hypothetical protein